MNKTDNPTRHEKRGKSSPADTQPVSQNPPPDLRLTQEEWNRYLQWAGEYQSQHAEVFGGPDDTLYITFELSVFGNRVIASRSGGLDDPRAIVLRDDWA